MTYLAYQHPADVLHEQIFMQHGQHATQHSFSEFLKKSHATHPIDHLPPRDLILRFEIRARSSVSPVRQPLLSVSNPKPLHLPQNQQILAKIFFPLQHANLTTPRLHFANKKTEVFFTVNGALFRAEVAFTVSTTS